MSNSVVHNWLCLLLRCATVLLCTAMAHAVQAQSARFDDAEFAATAISVRGTDDPVTGQLDLYVQVPIHQLTFESSPEGFTASYSVKAECSRLNERGEPQSVTLAPIWEQSVTRSFHAETQDRTAADLTTHTVSLDPGQYLVAVQFTDQNSNQTYFKEIIAHVREFDRPLALSDLVQLESYDPAVKELTPRVTGELEAFATDLTLYYLIYADHAETVTLTQELVSAGRARNEPADSDGSYIWTDTVNVTPGQHQQVSTIPLGDLEAGRYRVVVTLRDQFDRVRDRAQRMIVVRWEGLSSHLDNLEEAIEQLDYIARGRELRALRRASNDEERRRLFEEFWGKRDPTPTTPRNERMEEHYYRIDYANRKFRRQVPGWKTDRGLVYVLHGHPEDVQRQIYSYNTKPWEIWYYYRIGRQFIFVDQTGLGDYELVVPVWDDRNRID